ncbi:MAG: hypothetical protein ACPL4K_04770, partial [Candidatus Margulisiibacteriota bacterium]
YDIANCDGSTNGISVTASFGSEGTVEAELTENNGKLIAIIRHRFDRELQGPFPVIIKSKNGKEIRKEIYPPYYKTPEPTILGPCDYNPSPQINGTIQMNPDPSNVYVGDNVTFSIPASSIAECDGRTTGADPKNHLSVSFLIENDEHRASLKGEKYLSPPHIFSSAGNQKVFMKVNDLSRTTSQYVSIEFWVKDPASSSNKPSVAIAGPYAAHQGDI